MNKRVLISLDDTTDLLMIAENLINLDWEIIATDETYEILSRNSLPVTNIYSFLGLGERFHYPPTLHPKIEESLTLDQEPRIDMVYIRPYPLTKGIDIGGHTILALACKGKRVPVMQLEDMHKVIHQIEAFGDVPEDFRNKLISKTYGNIARHFLNLTTNGNKHYDGTIGVFYRRLQNGENPYQVPADLFSYQSSDPLGINKFEQMSGEAPCYTNIADCDNLLHSLCLLASSFQRNRGKIPFICLAAKHGNQCGASVDWDNPLNAVTKSLSGNPQAIWGGEVITNFPIDTALAEALSFSEEKEKKYGSPYWMLNVIMAPSFSGDAVSILGKNKGRKLLQNRALENIHLNNEIQIRNIRGGYMKQPPNNYVVDLNGNGIEKNISSEQLDSLLIAWSVAWNSFHGGNEIAIAKERRLLSAGGGPSTVEAAYCAVERGKRTRHDFNEAVFAANAFFPFPDAPEILIDNGCSLGIVPAGGKNEELVRAFFLQQKVKVIFVDAQYRGFSRH